MHLIAVSENNRHVYTKIIRLQFTKICMARRTVRQMTCVIND